MKKTLLITLFLSCLTNNYAQFGFRVGVSNSYFEQVENQDVSIGFYAGMWSRLNLGRIGLRNELNYYNSILKQKNNVSEINIVRSNVSNYIDLSSGLDFFINDDLAIQIGSGFHYLLRMKSKLKIDGSVDEGAFELDYLNFEQRLDLKMQMGISYNITENVLIDIRWERILAAGKWDWEFVDGYQTNIIKGGVGFMF